jgi:hypothetical protein
MDVNESPVYLLLNPAINHSQKDLPVTIYESGKAVFDLKFGIIKCIATNFSRSPEPSYATSRILFLLH